MPKPAPAKPAKQTTVVGTFHRLEPVLTAAQLSAILTTHKNGEKLTPREQAIVEARQKRKAERDAARGPEHRIPHIPVLTAEQRAELLAKPREELTQTERIALARAPREGVQAAPLKPEDMRRRGAIKAAERAVVEATTRWRLDPSEENSARMTAAVDALDAFRSKPTVAPSESAQPAAPVAKKGKRKAK